MGTATSSIHPFHGTIPPPTITSVTSSLPPNSFYAVALGRSISDIGFLRCDILSSSSRSSSTDSDSSPVHPLTHGGVIRFDPLEMLKRSEAVASQCVPSSYTHLLQLDDFRFAISCRHPDTIGMFDLRTPIVTASQKSPSIRRRRRGRGRGKAIHSSSRSRFRYDAFRSKKVAVRNWVRVPDCISSGNLIRSLSMNPQKEDRVFFVSSMENSTRLYIWDSRLHPKYRYSHCSSAVSGVGRVNALAISERLGYVFAGGFGDQICCFDVRTLKSVLSKKRSMGGVYAGDRSPMIAMDVVQEKDMVFETRGGNNVLAFDARTLNPISRAVSNLGSCEGIRCIPEVNLVCSAGREGSACWDFRKLSLPLWWNPDLRGSKSLDSSPLTSRRRIAMISAAQRFGVGLWDLLTGKKLETSVMDGIDTAEVVVLRPSEDEFFLRTILENEEERVSYFSSRPSLYSSCGCHQVRIWGSSELLLFRSFLL